MKFCEKCGNELSGEKFCPACGNKIEEVSENLQAEQNQTVEETVENVEESKTVIEEKVNTIKNLPNIKKSPKNILIAAIAIVAIVVAVIIIIASNSGPNFKKIYKEHCNEIWATVGEDNSYLSIDTNPYDIEDDGVAYAVAYSTIKTVNEELGLPASLFKDMGSTTGADGKQIEEFEEVTVSWKYHPDSGLEVMYKKK